MWALAVTWTVATRRAGNCIGEDSKDSIYGLWDYGGVICQRKELQAQYLQDITVPNATAGSYRKATDNGLVLPGKQYRID